MMCRIRRTLKQRIRFPWRTIRSWSCLKCGRCCKGYQVDLTSYEHAQITMHWPKAIRIGKWGDPRLVKKDKVCYFLEKDGLCGLQRFGMKPFVCKIWPFVVYSENNGDDVREAEFHQGAENYYVYLHPGSSRCPGINRGNPALLRPTISEIIEIYKNPFREQTYSTSK